MPGPSTTKVQQTVPTIGEKRKDKGKELVGGEHKKTKAHRETLVYTLTNDDMEHIGYQVWYIIEEVIEVATR
jgi:hypothetical protein